MLGKLDRTLRDESGLSALETAIVLIAFVVVASVFAFTMLSAGMFSTERSKEAVYAGLEEVRSSMELRGSVVVTATAANGDVDTVIFTVSNVAGGDVIDLTPHDAVDDNSKVVIDYRDANQVKSSLRWDVEWLVQGSGDDDNLLEEGELAQITISGLATDGLSNTLSSKLGANTLFDLEIKPPSGGVLNIERRTPAAIDQIMDLK